MLFFGHLGLTLAAAVTARSKIKAMGQAFPVMDYRAVLTGSILPDLIDKPLALIFRDTFHGASRLFAHTLLFSAFITALGIYLWRKHNRPGWLLLAGGSLFHMVFDSMWNYKATLLWPFFGWTFPPRVRESFFLYLINEVLHNPYTYIPELAGLSVIIYFTADLVRKKKQKH